MRRQRLLRTSSAQPLCIFCAACFHPRVALVPRRRINTSRPSSQQAATAQASPRPFGSVEEQAVVEEVHLTAAERRERDRRVEARKAQLRAQEQEDERKRIAEFERRRADQENFARQQRLLKEAAGKRRNDDLEARDLERRRLEMERRKLGGDRRAERRWRQDEQRTSKVLFGASQRQEDRQVTPPSPAPVQKKPPPPPPTVTSGASMPPLEDWELEDAKGGKKREQQPPPPPEPQSKYSFPRPDAEEEAVVSTEHRPPSLPPARDSQQDGYLILRNRPGSGFLRTNRDTFWDPPQANTPPPPTQNIAGGSNYGVGTPLDSYSINDSGYRAAPLDPSDYTRRTPVVDDSQASSWQHLPRRDLHNHDDDPFNHPAIPQRRPPPPTRNPFGDPEEVERDFRQHQQNRPSYPPLPRDLDLDQNAVRYGNPDRLERPRKCARCLQFGHTARECTNEVQAKCHRCGAIGHMSYDCPNGRTTNRQPPEQRKPHSDAAPIADRVLVRRTPSTAPYSHEGTRDQPSDPGHIGRSRDVLPSESFTNVIDRALDSTRPREDQAREANFTHFSPASTPKPGTHQEFSQEPEESMNRPQIEQRFKAPAENTIEQNRRAKRSARGFEDEAEIEDEKSYRKDKKSSRREIRVRDEEADDEAAAAREERAAKKAARKAAREAEKAERNAQVKLPEFISIQNLAQALGVHYESFVHRLETLGYDDLFPGKVLNAETSGMVAMEYNFEPIFEQSGSREDAERDLHPQPEAVDKDSLPTRPPVVTIMGHVDHGKTTILDFLRKSSVAAGEAGGITQHIGAFSVPMSSSEKTITFLDTPGHAAFLAMRQRGANVTDIVILVVAADDSVKPQTLESLRCAREAGVPILVAINKVDKEGADVQRVKQDLARNGVEIEDFGGEVQVVEVSGKTGQGMEDLEEAVATLSEILDHRADIANGVEGWVLEATTKAHGRVATVLVKRGTLQPGTVLVAGRTWAKVRTLRNERGEEVQSVAPGLPVEVDGWRDDPVAGDQVLQAQDEHKAVSVIDYRLERAERERMEKDTEAINAARRAEQVKRASTQQQQKNARFAAYADVLEGVDEEPEPEQTAPAAQEESQGQITVPILIKADVSGSAEAVAAYIPSLTSPLIKPQIIYSGVGPIHQSDIDLISATPTSNGSSANANGYIIAFNLPPNEGMKAEAQSKGVGVLENNVIYRVLDDVKEVMENKLPPIIRQRVLGEAEVGASFHIGVGGRKTMKIAGCKIRNGAVGVRARARVLRGGEGVKVYDGVITSLKNVKKDVQEMRKGTECGMGFEGWEGFEVGDLVQTYEEVSERRKL